MSLTYYVINFFGVHTLTDCFFLDGSDVSEPGLRSLMLLPNLEELKMKPIKITLTKEAKKLKKLTMFDFVESVDLDNLAGAMVFMPSLSSLMLETPSDGNHPMNLTAARTMKEVIHSRRQNITLHSIHPNLKVEILCNAPGPKKECSIYANNYIFERLLILTQV